MRPVTQTIVKLRMFITYSVDLSGVGAVKCDFTPFSGASTSALAMNELKFIFLEVL